jgi:catechol 2,3-dioxygenase-like lactoylglutathione lyase family enzyme
MKLAAVTYVVRDYDEAIAWFVDVLGFTLVEDTALTDAKRWVRVAASDGDVCLLLARADGPAQELAIGAAAGGRVGFFLYTDDFQDSFERMRSNGVKFREAPRLESFGWVAVFEDLYGNPWDLIEPKTALVAK